MIRENMTIEEEREFVAKCFEEYEKDIVKTFWTPYTDYRDRIGQKFEIVRRLTEEDVDLECLPMWRIRFKDGKEIDAYPEEIVSSEVESIKNRYLNL